MPTEYEPEGQFLKLFKVGIEKAFEEEVQKGIEALKQDLDRRKGEIVAGVAIRIMGRADINTLDNRIIITVATKE